MLSAQLFTIAQGLALLLVVVALCALDRNSSRRKRP